MSIFGSIASAIFGKSSVPGTTAATGSTTSSTKPLAATPAAPGATPAKPMNSTTSAPGPATAAAKPMSSMTAAPGPATAAAKPMSVDDVNAMIEKLAAGDHEDLNWKESIVDLMKLLKLDSGFGARKQLAQELGYTGPLNGSAEMNTWLHQQVMTKLAESGGMVPESLKKSA
jgi:hypothetical protein